MTEVLKVLSNECFICHKKVKIDWRNNENIFWAIQLHPWLPCVPANSIQANNVNDWIHSVTFEFETWMHLNGLFWRQPYKRNFVHYCIYYERVILIQITVLVIWYDNLSNNLALILSFKTNHFIGLSHGHF
jgi:hypothetical protein